MWKCIETKLGGADMVREGASRIFEVWHEGAHFQGNSHMRRAPFGVPRPLMVSTKSAPANAMRTGPTGTPHTWCRSSPAKSCPNKSLRCNRGGEQVWDRLRTVAALRRFSSSHGHRRREFVTPDKSLLVASRGRESPRLGQLRNLRFADCVCAIRQSCQKQPLCPPASRIRC